MPYFLIPFLWYGIAFGLSSASILQRPRLWVVKRVHFIALMLRCSYCTGFHAGWLSYLLLFLGRVPFDFRNMFSYAFASAAFCYLADNCAQALEKYVDAQDLQRHSESDPQKGS